MLTKMLKNRWTESIAISLSFPVIGYAIDPSDPFFINYEFPWLILAPVLGWSAIWVCCGNHFCHTAYQPGHEWLFPGMARAFLLFRKK